MLVSPGLITKGHVFVNLEGSTPQVLSGLISSWRRVARRPAGRALTQQSPGSPVPPHIPCREWDLSRCDVSDTSTDNELWVASRIFAGEHLLQLLNGPGYDRRSREGKAS